MLKMMGKKIFTIVFCFSKPVYTSRKRLRAKNTPDLHLSYSKTEGKAGMVDKKDSASKNTLYFKWKYKV